MMKYCDLQFIYIFICYWLPELEKATFIHRYRNIFFFMFCSITFCMPAKCLLAPQQKLLYASGAAGVINIF